jgi:hypothetical protein
MLDRCADCLLRKATVISSPPEEPPEEAKLSGPPDTPVTYWAKYDRLRAIVAGPGAGVALPGIDPDTDSETEETAVDSEAGEDVCSCSARGRGLAGCLPAAFSVMADNFGDCRCCLRVRDLDGMGSGLCSEDNDGGRMLSSGSSSSTPTSDSPEWRDGKYDGGSRDPGPSEAPED